LYSLVGGVALTLLCYLHGLNYIALRTEGPVRYRAKNYAQLLYGVLYFGLVAFAILMYFKTDFFQNNFAVTLILLVVIVLLTIIANVSVFRNKEMLAFITSGLTLIALVALLFSGLFPRVLISSIPGNDLLIEHASSSPYTLKVMSYISLTILPFVLGYTAWTYYIFRKRIKHPHEIGVQSNY
jgi:cytochrome d ubiquinol oxidase subunit II